MCCIIIYHDYGLKRIRDSLLKNRSKQTAMQSLKKCVCQYSFCLPKTTKLTQNNRLHAPDTDPSAVAVSRIRRIF